MCDNYCKQEYTGHCVSSFYGYYCVDEWQGNVSNGNCKCMGTTCTKKCDADSLVCVRGGDTWDSENCKCNKCDQNDTSWTELTQCKYNALKGMYFVEKTTYTLKDCQLSSSSIQYTAPQCEDNDSLYRCLGTINGSQVMMQAPNGATFNCNADGSCDTAMRQIASGECKPPPPPSSSESGGSSSSAESSSSGDSSSSGGDSSDSGSSDSSDGSNDWEGWMKDSLGAIHGTLYNVEFFTSKTYDGVMELNGTAHDINQNTRDIANTGMEISGKLDNTNDYLRQIAGKNFNPTINVGSPNVNVDIDTDGLRAAQDRTTDTLHRSNQILEEIKGLLGSSGSDTIRIDTSKAPASIDSALKYWGNRNNHTFAAAGLDTSGWGHTNDSAIAATDSVLSRADFFGSLGCDTTGGKKCDGSIIGADGLATATGSVKATYGELRDSLTGGAYADSLRLWGGKFTGNGVLTGSGSNSCPSVLTKTYRVDIYKGAGYDFTLGTYLCTPLFGTTTAWSLCRMLLRATIALGCMWFLFKCATGFGGGSED